MESLLKGCDAVVGSYVTKVTTILPKFIFFDKNIHLFSYNVGNEHKIPDNLALHLKILFVKI